VADPTFSQADRRNFALPILIAVLVLAGAAYLLLRFTPHTTADLQITQLKTWQAHTVFKSDTILVGQDKAQDDLYVLTTLRIEDRLRLPLFLKDFTATLITADGETLATSAAEHHELDPLYTTFPALKALATPPLLREAQITPGQSDEGMILLHFPITQDTWNKRKSATITIDLYHQSSQTIAIPPDSIVKK
jgi:hypothetical protein